MKPGIFNRIKQNCMLLLAFVMVFKAFLAPAVYLDFKLNQDYISKVLCINREKPQLECNGQCILMKKMKKSQEAESPEQNHIPKSQLLEIFSPIVNGFRPLNFPYLVKKYSFFVEQITTRSLSNLFHPPRIV